MNERDEHLLLFIKDEAEYLLEKAESHDLDDLLSDKDLQHIVTMALINISESVNSLSDGFIQKHQDIEWSEIVGLRNKVVHNYRGLPYELDLEKCYKGCSRAVGTGARDASS
jgi:uncharacterized protein with HEPN domain